jgi:hypothetical protein
MQNAVVIKGKLIGPTQIQLHEPFQSSEASVAVIVCPISSTNPASQDQSIFDFLQTLPAGTRSKEDIDRQVAHQRDWDNS